jgi:hypothetical protein
VEPDNSLNPLENAFFTVPKPKSITHETVSLRDIRREIFSESPKISLATHAFTAVKHKTALLSPPYDADIFTDPDLVEKIYIPEVEEIIKNLTGALKIIVIRSAIRSKKPDPPAPEIQEKTDINKEEKKDGLDLDHLQYSQQGSDGSRSTGPSCVLHRGRLVRDSTLSHRLAARGSRHHYGRRRGRSFE